MNNLLIITVVLFCLSACGTVAVPVPPTGEDVTDTPSAAVKTLVNDVGGFAFDYPVDWNFAGLPPPENLLHGFTLFSFEPDSGSGIEGIPPPGETQIDVDVNLKPSEIDALRKSLTDGVIDLTQETWQLSANIQAIWIHETVPATEDKDAGDVEMLFSEINGWGIFMGCYGETTPCKAIMHSLRLLPAK